MRFKTRPDQASAFQVGLFLLVIAVALLLVSCKKNTNDTTASVDTRWMDRTIYLADPNVNDPFRNNFFQKEKVKEAITDISTGSSLGSNYFTFSQVPESNLEPITKTQDGTDFKSFVLIWPDDVFNAYVENSLGNDVPDQNALTIVNAANKKQFFIIVRASCTQVSATCGNITDKGFKALIARQFGLLVGLRTDCSNPQNVMCATPSDLQWSDTNQFNYFNAVNNQLESILQTPGFYQ